MKWVCVCTHWSWCKSFRWPQQGWASLFPWASLSNPARCSSCGDCLSHHSGSKADSKEPGPLQVAPSQAQVPCTHARAQPSSTFPILGQEKKSIRSPSPQLRKTSAWDAVVSVSSAGLFQTSGNIFSLPGILRRLQETSSVTCCQLLVCHGGSTASPVWGSPDARMSSGWSHCSGAKHCWYQVHLSSSGCWVWHHPAPPCSCLTFISSIYLYCKHGHVHKKCSIRCDHLGRQMTATSLLCLNVEYILKKSTIKMETWFDNFLQMQ